MKKFMLALLVAIISCLMDILPVVAETQPPDPLDDAPGGYGGFTGEGEGGTGGGESGTNRPDKPGEGGGGGGGGGGESEDSVILTGAWQYTCETNTLAGQTLTSTTSDQNVILAMTNAYLTVSNCVLNKSGDTSSEENSNFFALNAVVAAKSAAKICISNSDLNSNADGANCLFASGNGSTIYAYNCTLSSTTNSSRGLDATYEGTVIASKMNINTKGDHCASLATDRGNGNISVTDSSLATAGQGSALIYSTGTIEVNSVTGTATGAQIAGIEGLSTIRIKNSGLTGSGEKASEPVANGVIIYQSMSGDSSEGTATFEVSDSTLASEINDGAMFYITHSEAVITVQDTVLDFDSVNNYLLKAAGNDGENGWGNAGSNGAEVVFTAIDQSLAGKITVDGISSLDMYLVDSEYTGTFENDTTYTGDGEGIDLFINSNSTWTVTADCTLKNLTVTDGAAIVDGNGNAVSIVDTDGTEYVSGTSNPKITVETYTTGSFVATNITEFAIDRSAFNTMYGLTQSGEGGATDHDGWVYYCQPHPPDNAIVKVKVADATEYGTPDRDHKYRLDGYWDGTAEPGVVVHLLYVTTEGYLFPDGCTSNTWDVTVTNNAQEIDPPESVVAIKAQAKSGRTYYLTLKEAIDAAQDRSRVILNGDVTLEETLTVTNSITLDLDGTNVITLGSALTNAFVFSAKTTVSNGTINSSLAANVEGSVLMRFMDCKGTLKDLTINGGGYETVVARDSSKDAAKKYQKDASDAMTCDGLILTGNGCLLSVDYANATLTNNCSLTVDGTRASFGGTHAAAVSCTGNGTITIADGTYTAAKVLQVDDFGGAITVNGGTFSGQIYSWMSANAHTNLNAYANYTAQFALNGGTYTDATIAFAYADSLDFSAFTKGDEVTIAAPSGYAWKDNALVRESITAGVASESYSDAQTATSAAAQINADKESNIAVPTGVEASAMETYLSKIEATVTSDNRIVVDLTSAAKVEEQILVNAAVTNEASIAALTSTNATAKATIAVTTPGLYYWIEGGTDVGAITEAGQAQLSTDGGAVELSKPALDATNGRAFFKIAAGVSSPAQSND